MRKALFEAYRDACAALQGAGVPNAVTDARLMCEAAYGASLSRALGGLCGAVPQNARRTLDGMLERRLSGEPLQYILGSWDFMGYTFAVGKGVLIPRSETEVLVERTAGLLKKIKWPVVYDLCAGSGCIGLSIKKMLPDARVFLVEKSKDALVWLNENRRALGLERSTVAIKGDILGGWEAFSSLPAPDCIISNPPYVERGELDGLQREVGYEPRMALDGGEDGLLFYRCLCESWFSAIKDGGFMALECGENQAEKIVSLFKNSKSEIFADYCGVDRFIIGKKENPDDT